MDVLNFYSKKLRESTQQAEAGTLDTPMMLLLLEQFNNSISKVHRYDEGLMAVIRHLKQFAIIEIEEGRIKSAKEIYVFYFNGLNFKR